MRIRYSRVVNVHEGCGMKDKSTTIKLGKATVRATYKRLNAIAQPGAKVGHHDFVEHDPGELALRELRGKLKKARR
jgi:hypothetical protein